MEDFNYTWYFKDNSNIANRFTVHEHCGDTTITLYIMGFNGISFARLYWYKDDNTSIYLADLSVCNSCTGHGLGKELQEIREDIGKKLGAKYSYLLVDKGSWMQDWYKRRGYKDIHKEEDGRVWMKKKL